MGRTRRATTVQPKPKPEPKPTEWLVAHEPLASYISNEGDAPFRPEAILWVDGETRILGITTHRPDWSVAEVAKSLEKTETKPLVEGAGPPTRIRTSSERLAAALRELVRGEIEVVVAPTPELAETIASLHAHVADPSRTPPQRRYLSAGLEPEALERLFVAAARLYAAKPWALGPTAHRVIAATSDALGLEAARVCLVDNAGDDVCGIILFRSAALWQEFSERLALTGGVPDASNMPEHTSLTFVPIGELEEALVEDAKTHGWTWPAEGILPDFATVDELGLIRSVDARELAQLTAIVTALDAAVRDPVVGAAFAAGEDFSWDRSVATPAGDVDVAIGSLIDEEEPFEEPDDELVQQVYEAGMRAGFDISTEEGAAAFAAAVEEKGPHAFFGPAATADWAPGMASGFVDPAKTKANRQRAKNARKARKKARKKR